MREQKKDRNLFRWMISERYYNEQRDTWTTDLLLQKIMTES